MLLSGKLLPYSLMLDEAGKAKHSSLFCLFVSDEKKLYNNNFGPIVIKEPTLNWST
jgi:hypothetical protein